MSDAGPSGATPGEPAAAPMGTDPNPGAAAAATGKEAPCGDAADLDRQVDVWKTVIAVQQHFNDIELKIRGLALTVLTAVLGATGLAVKDGTSIRVGGATVHLAAMLLAAGALVWLAFYFVDQVWYHRLLMGAVRQGEAIEDQLAPCVPGIGLTHRISKESGYSFWFFGQRVLHSKHKLKLFYYSVLGVLILLAAVTQFGLSPTAASITHSPQRMHTQRQSTCDLRHHEARDLRCTRQPPRSEHRHHR